MFILVKSLLSIYSDNTFTPTLKTNTIFYMFNDVFLGRDKQLFR